MKDDGLNYVISKDAFIASPMSHVANKNTELVSTISRVLLDSEMATDGLVLVIWNISRMIDDMELEAIAVTSVHWKIIIANANYTHIIYAGDLDKKGLQIPKTMLDDIHEIQGSDFTTLVRVQQDSTKYGAELENADVEYIRDMFRSEVKNLIDDDKWNYDLSIEAEEINELRAAS